MRGTRQAGFTLLEMIVVTTLIGILMAIAAPTLLNYPIRAKEAVLKTNLRAIRDSLEKFYGDKGRYPAALEDLVPHYLKQMPVDPFTKSSTSWVAVLEDEDEDEGERFGPSRSDDPESAPGIVDVRSAAKGKALDGSSYADW